MQRWPTARLKLHNVVRTRCRLWSATLFNVSLRNSVLNWCLQSNYMQQNIGLFKLYAACSIQQFVGDCWSHLDLTASLWKRKWVGKKILPIPLSFVKLIPISLLTVSPSCLRVAPGEGCFSIDELSADWRRRGLFAGTCMGGSWFIGLDAF